MKLYIQPIVLCLLLFGCNLDNKESDFYQNNIDILKAEYLLKKTEFNRLYTSERGATAIFIELDSMENMILQLNDVESENEKSLKINEIKNLFKHRSMSIESPFFEEMSKSSYSDRLKIKYFSQLILNSFINNELYNLRYKYSFDMMVLHTDIKNIGDSMEVKSYLTGSNFYKPNFVTMDGDTIKESGPNQILFKCKKMTEEQLLKEMDFYYYHIDKYKSY